MLSVRAREAIKTGLAMVAAIAIALRMDFLEPYWAGFAVAFISLETAGQSLNKGALRMLGTIVGMLASLVLMALFPQQRWGMMLGLTPYIGFCAYMVAGNKRTYAWFVAGFVAITIMVKAGADSLSMFQFAVARVEETVLGIGVYALVSTFLWPRNSREALEATARDLLETQVAIFRAYRGLLAGRGRLEDSRPLRLEADTRHRQLEQLLAAAETDTYQVWELRHAWRGLVAESMAVLQALGRWRTTLPEVRPLDLDRLVPGLDAKLAEVERRLAGAGPVLGGEGSEPLPPATALEPDDGALRSLSHFEQAALAQLLTQLRRLDDASRRLLESIRDIRGSGEIATPASAAAGPRAGFSLDLDRLRAAVTVVATMWVGFGLWIWLDPPGHASFWFGCTLFALLALLAKRSLRALLPGILLGTVVGGVAYVGVMPHLSGYRELGLMIFVVTAGSSYLLWGPRYGPMKPACLAMFLTFISVTNQQSYSFAGYANGVASFLLSAALVIAMESVLGSPRPEKVFLRLLARYFRHAELLMSRLAPEREPRGLVARWRSVTYRNDLLDLPAKLAALVDQIDYRLLPGTQPDRVRHLVMNLTDLTWRIKELVDARDHVSPDPRMEELVAELREWRLLAQQQFRLWSRDPAAALHPSADMSERLHARLSRIGGALEAARSRAGAPGPPLDYQALYRYLGGFRGLSESAIGYADVASEVAWEPWREARF